jgi:hypothetical protein
MNMLNMSPLRGVSHQIQPRGLESGTKQASLFAVAIPFIAITTVIVVLRIYVRLRLKQLCLAIDDCKSTFTRKSRNVVTDMIESRSDALWCILHDLAVYCQHGL